jgi:uncharacterized protein YdhG (YjbR/CyaY superfamily)
MAKAATVDEYLAGLPEDRRAAMEDIRRAVTAAAPEAVEAISYNMPAFKLDGRFFVSYDAFKAHYSLFPWSDRMVAELGQAIAPYVHGRGTLRFPAGEPIPTELIKRIVAIRLEEHAAERPR